MKDTLQVMTVAPRLAPASRPGDVALAKVNDAREDPILSPEELSERCSRACQKALPGGSAYEHEALAQELVLLIQRREGTWTPRLSRVAQRHLMLKAVGLARDLGSWGDAAPESVDVYEPDPEHGDNPLAAMLAAPLPHSDPAWREVASALECPEGSQESDVVYAALSGYKAGDLAVAQGRTPENARKRLERGRTALRGRVGTRDGLIERLARADVADRPRLDTEGPLAAIGAGNGDRKPHAARLPELARTSDGQEKWEGCSCPVSRFEKVAA